MKFWPTKAENGKFGCIITAHLGDKKTMHRIQRCFTAFCILAGQNFFKLLSDCFDYDKRQIGTLESNLYGGG